MWKGLGQFGDFRMRLRIILANFFFTTIDGIAILANKARMKVNCLCTRSRKPFLNKTSPSTAAVNALVLYTRSVEETISG